MHIFTELVGIQMLLMNALEPLLRGEKMAQEQLAELHRGLLGEVPSCHRVRSCAIARNQVRARRCPDNFDFGRGHRLFPASPIRLSTGLFKNIRHLPILENGKLVGVVTLADLVRLHRRVECRPQITR
jgi:CBS domain-containing protein